MLWIICNPSSGSVECAWLKLLVIFFMCIVGVWQHDFWTVIWTGMSNLYDIVPKMLTWIIIDEVDLDLNCNMNRNVRFVWYSSKNANLKNNWWSGSGFGTIPYKYDIPLHITVQNYTAKHQLRTWIISRVISVKHVQQSLMMDHKRSQKCWGDF